MKESTQFDSLKLLYRFTKDGPTFDKVYPKIADKKDTLTIVKSNYGKVFGGYASIPWTKSSKWHKDSNAFIFSLTNLHKYNQISEDNHAIQHYSDGLFWGKNNYDLYLHLQSSGQDCRCEGLGEAYKLPIG